MAYYKKINLYMHVHSMLLLPFLGPSFMFHPDRKPSLSSFGTGRPILKLAVQFRMNVSSQLQPFAVNTHAQYKRKTAVYDGRMRA